MAAMLSAIYLRLHATVGRLQKQLVYLIIELDLNLSFNYQLDSIALYKPWSTNPHVNKPADKLTNDDSIAE
jgi:hypothetical protein